MNIGIVDVDGHNFPNFALMKISAWHEISLSFLSGNYDHVYQSKIFSRSLPILPTLTERVRKRPRPVCQQTNDIQIMHLCRILSTQRIQV